MMYARSERERQRWKIAILAISIVLISIHVIYVMIGGETDRQYYASGNADVSYADAVPCQDISIFFSSDQQRLNSLELVFDGIPEDKAGAIVAKILRNDALIYQGNVSLSNLNNRKWEKIFVNMPLKRGEEYELAISADENCKVIPSVLLVNDNGAPEQARSESGGNF